MTLLASYLRSVGRLRRQADAARRSLRLTVDECQRLRAELGKEQQRHAATRAQLEEIKRLNLNVVGQLSESVLLANAEAEVAYAAMWHLHEEADKLAAEVARLERLIHPSGGGG